MEGALQAGNASLGHRICLLKPGVSPHSPSKRPIMPGMGAARPGNGPLMSGLFRKCQAKIGFPRHKPIWPDMVFISIRPLLGQALTILGLAGAIQI